MVALGTSLPELMTAIAAVRKGHPEITVGNIVGANVLNCLLLLVLLLQPDHFRSHLTFTLFTFLLCSLSSIPFDTSYSGTEMVILRKLKESGF
jgi:Ca2+/Na+ antiporter